MPNPTTKPEHGEQEVGHYELVPELRYACDNGRQDGDEDERYAHPRGDAASHAEEIGNLSVLFDVEGLGNEVIHGGVTAGRGSETLVGGG